MKKNLKLMLKELCCSRCKSDFDENSINFIHQNKECNVVNIVCQKCGKDFGLAFLKITDNTSKNNEDLILKDSRNTPPINYDDVIDAHRYIKDLEKNWHDFIKE